MAADPVVVLVGTLDTKGHELEYMRDRVREAGADVHNPTVTLMRTTAEENVELGRRIAEKLNSAGSPAVSSCPSAASRPSTSTTSPPTTRRPTQRSSMRCASTSTATAWRCGRSTQVNDPAFATGMAERLHELIHEAR